MIRGLLFVLLIRFAQIRHITVSNAKLKIAPAAGLTDKQGAFQIRKGLTPLPQPLAELFFDVIVPPEASLDQGQALEGQRLAVESIRPFLATQEIDVEQTSEPMRNAR